ncbi:MAG: hypothetical protein WA847_22250 [Terriglobales bacterium]
MTIWKNAFTSCLTVLICAVASFGQAPPEIKSKLDAKIKQLSSFSIDPEIVNAVKAHNATPHAGEALTMTNEQWHSLTVLDPFVRATAKTPLSEYLKTKKNADDTIAKVFVSGADGSKVGFDAKETAKATEDISRKVEAIQTDTKAAVDAIASISGVINQVGDISGTIATAVEEQSATTNEMARNVNEAAQGSGEITSNITGVAEAAQGTTRGATDTQKASQQLVEMSTQLRSLVGQFKIKASGTRPTAVANPSVKGMAAHASA